MGNAFFGKRIKGKRISGERHCYGSCSPTAQKAITAYFIMGRKQNSRNRISWKRGNEFAPRPTMPRKMEGRS